MPFTPPAPDEIEQPSFVPPAPDEIEPEKTSALGAAGRAAVTGVLPGAAFATTAGAVYPWATGLLAETGPAAPFLGGLASLAAGAGAAGLAALAQKKVAETVAPQTTKRLEELQAADVAQHPVASFGGELASGIPSMRLSPGTVIRGARLLPRVISGVATTAEKQAVGEAAGRIAGGAAAGAVLPIITEGRLPTLKDVAEGTAYATTLGEVRWKAPGAAAGARFMARRMSQFRPPPPDSRETPPPPQTEVPPPISEEVPPEPPPQPKAKLSLAEKILQSRGVAPDVAAYVAERAGDKPANEDAETYRERVNGLHDDLGFVVADEQRRYTTDDPVERQAQLDFVQRESAKHNSDLMRRLQRIQRAQQSTTGATDASSIGSTETEAQREVRSRMGEAPPLRQPGETPVPRPEAPPEEAKANEPVQLTPAIQLPSGKVYTGTTHPEAIGLARAAGEKIPDDNESMRGFLKPDGTFIDRKEGAAEFEQATGKAITREEGLHSEDLIEQRSKAEAGPQPGPIPSLPETQPQTYEDFKKQYTDLFRQLQKYKPGEVGSEVFAEKMAALHDLNPEWTNRVEEESKPPQKSIPVNPRDLQVGDRIFTTDYGYITIEKVLPFDPKYPRSQQVETDRGRRNFDPSRPIMVDRKPQKEGEINAEKEKGQKEGDVLTPTAAETPPPPAPTVTPPVTEKEHPVTQSVRNRLLAGETVSRNDILTTGQTLGLDAKQSEEFAEVGIVQAARQIAQGEGTEVEKYRKIVDLYNRSPNLTTRTVESKVNQAYSTPPPLAYIAGVLGDLRGGKKIVEPTAGHGMLLIEANPKAKLALNELDPKRAERLKGIFPKAEVTQLDATVANPPEHDRLIANPPFGSRVDAQGNTVQFPLREAITAKKTTPSIDLAIAFNSLHSLTKDGKGVLIIGAKTGTPGPGFGDPTLRAQDYNRPEFLQLFKQFKVKDWFTVSGDLYSKMGAGWPVDVIVVDGKGETPSSQSGGFVRPWVSPPKVYDTWAELESKLKPESGRGTEPSGGGVLPPEGPGVAERPRAPEPRPPGTPQQPVGPRTRPARISGVERPPAPQAVVERELPRPSGPEPVARPAEPVVEPAAPAEEPGIPSVAGERPQPVIPSGGEGGQLNTPYRSASQNTDPKLVAPSNMADAMRSALDRLQSDARQPVDDYVAGKLGWSKQQLFERMSAAQIDSVALAIRNIERGTALITGDQMGVGKGRQVAAVIEYVRQQGLIPVFITAKKALYEDMAGRDLPGVGNPNFRPFITDRTYAYMDASGKEIKNNERKEDLLEAIRTEKALPQGYDGIFTTYDQLKADKPEGWTEEPKARFKRKKNGGAKPDGPRLAALRAIADRAVFILDESHTAAGTDSDLFLSLRGILPKGKGAFFASATFAKRPENLALYAGSTSMGKAISQDSKGLQKFLELMKQGGNPLQQVLSTMLTKAGEFVRREQNWGADPNIPGDQPVAFHFKRSTENAAAEAAAADTYTEYLRDLMRLAEHINAAASRMENAENQVRAEEETVAVEPMVFGSRLFNLSNQYLLALRSESIAQEAIDILKTGRKPFVALHNTMEGPMQDLQAMNLPLSFAGILRREMEKMLTVTIRDPMEEKGKRYEKINPEDLPDGGRFFRDLEARINATDFGAFPISPIDYIKRRVTEAGFSIGEITARDSMLEEGAGEPTLTKRGKQERNVILRNFNHGQLDGLVVNGSSSTGVSAHTDPRFKDQRQRVMVVGQPAPDINAFMQMLGRVMRFGQTSKPEYRVLQSSLAAEQRFMTMLRRKLTSLNANTTADTESDLTGNKGFAEDIFNVVGDKVVYEVMQANPELALQADIHVPEPGEEISDYAKQATGRFVLLKNADAESLWNQIADHFNDTIESLNETGENPLKATVEDFRARTISAREIEKATGDTEFDAPVVLENVLVQTPRKPMPHAEAEALGETNAGAARAALRDWIKKSQEAEDKRVASAERRGLKPEQINHLREQFNNTRQTVAMAIERLGQTYGVDPVGEGGAVFHGVAVDLKLSDKAADFTSPSKQRLVLAVNTTKRMLQLPLSRTEASGVLNPSDGATYDGNAEHTAQRHIVTGNILRGYQAALEMGGDARPQVTFYTKEDGSQSLGVVLSKTAKVASAGRGKVIADAEDFVRAIRQGKGAVAGEIEVTPTGEVRLPANSEYKPVWGHPDFRSTLEGGFAQQKGSVLVGQLRPESAAKFFQIAEKAGYKFGEMEAESKPSDVANAIADKLAGLKVPQKNIQLFGVVPAVWNAAIDLAMGVVRAGGKVADAVAKALEYIRANHKGPWDEAGATRMIEEAANAPAPKPVTTEEDSTQRMGVVDTIMSREHNTPEGDARSMTHAGQVLEAAGLADVVQPNRAMGGWEFVADGFEHNQEGHQLIAGVEKALAEYNTPGHPEVHSLINTIRQNQASGAMNDIFTGREGQAIRDRLYALTQGEASTRGRLLQALQRVGDHLLVAAQDVRTHLTRVYNAAFGGDAYESIMNRVRLTLNPLLGEAATTALMEHPEVQQFFDRLAASNRRDEGGRVYRRVQQLLKPKAAKKLSRMQTDARIQEAVNEIIQQAKAQGIEVKPVPGKKALTPLEQLMHLVNPENAAKIDKLLAQAVKDAEFNAGWAEMAGKMGEDELADARAVGEAPPPEAVEAGLNRKEFAHWKVIRDNLLSYSPTTLDLAQRVLRGDFRGMRFKPGVPRPPETRIDLAKLARAPEEEIQRVLNDWMAGIDATMETSGATPETRQRMRQLMMREIEGQLEQAQARVRDPLFAPPKKGTALTAEQRMGQLLRAGLFADPRLDIPEMVERLAAKSAVNKLTPTMATLAKQILATPFYQQSELKTRFLDETVNKWGISPGEAENMWNVFERAFDARFTAAKAKAFDQAAGSLSRLTPKEREVITGPSKLTRIQQAVNAGALDSGAILRGIAAERGWSPPTDAEVARLKALAEQEMRLRTLTEAQRDERRRMGDTDEQIARAEAAKAADTVYQRDAIKKQMGIMLARMTRPIVMPWESLTGFWAQKKNAYDALHEYITLNLVFKPGFEAYRLITHLTTQGVWHSMIRPLAKAFEIAEKQGNSIPAWHEVTRAYGDAVQGTLAAWKQALIAGRAEFMGRGESRNVDRLMSGINALERMADQARQAWARGDYGRAMALYILQAPRQVTWFISAVDAWQGKLVEFQDMLHRADLAMVEKGMSAAEREAHRAELLSMMKHQMVNAAEQAGRTLHQAALEAGKPPPTEAQIHEAAVSRVKFELYEKMRRDGLPADQISADVEGLRRTLAWQDEVRRGVGGAVASVVKKLPLNFGTFSNAIGNSINWQLQKLPPGLSWLAEYGKGPHSGWYATALDRRQRTLESWAGTALGALVVGLVANKMLRVNSYGQLLTKEERDLMEAQGHRPGTVEITLPDGSFIPLSLSVGPATIVAPYLAAAGHWMDVLTRREREQAKLNAEAAKKGLPPGKIRDLNALDYAGVGLAGAYAAVLGTKTVSGAVGSVFDQGVPNARRLVASTVSSMVPFLPAYQEIARMQGITLDKHLASVWDYMVPLPTSQARAVNVLGDPVGTQNGVQRMIQVITAGTYPGIIHPGDIKDQAAYAALINSDYRPPAINPKKAVEINGVYRTMTDAELVKYTENRGKAFKEALSALGPNADHDSVKAAFAQADSEALSSVGAAKTKNLAKAAPSGGPAAAVPRGTLPRVSALAAGVRGRRLGGRLRAGRAALGGVRRGARGRPTRRLSAFSRPSRLSRRRARLV